MFKITWICRKYRKCNFSTKRGIRYINQSILQTLKGGIPMASDVLKLTADIVISHVSMTELTPKELVDEIKCIHALLSSFDGGSEAPVALVASKGEAGIV